MTPMPNPAQPEPVSGQLPPEPGHVMRKEAYQRLLEQQR